jgi:hypothetical protein
LWIGLHAMVWQLFIPTSLLFQSMKTLTMFWIHA